MSGNSDVGAATGVSLDELRSLLYLVRREQNRIEVALSGLRTAHATELGDSLRRANRHARQLAHATEDLVTAIGRAADLDNHQQHSI